MTSTILLFAGQGAQTVGMGKDFAEKSPSARALFDQANSVLGYDLAQICFEGPEDELTKTEHAQPGIFLTSWVAFQLLMEKLPTFAFQGAAGLSLGEFTALTAANALSFEDGLRLVWQRGQYMQEACEKTKGAMAAILGLDDAIVREVCEQAHVQLANLNCPGQHVISGEAGQIAEACELARSRGAIRAKPLAVAGAYHSRLMESAQPKLRTALQRAAISAPTVPVISNVTAHQHGAPADIKSRLVDQVISSVRWEESMRNLIAEGHKRFIEFGPGSTLSGFLKRIDSSVQRFNVSDMPSLQATIQALAT
jgi:[acyl-carrier-protein] S-malonyltransferase